MSVNDLIPIIPSGPCLDVVQVVCSSTVTKWKLSQPSIEHCQVSATVRG